MLSIQTPKEAVPRPEAPILIPFSLAVLIEEISTPIAARARGKGVEFRSFIARDVPATILGDRASLRLVLETLLNNAVRFTEKGEVRIDIRTDAERGQSPESGPILRFTVMDTGIGINRKACAHAFEGDGLASSRRAVQLMGSDLRVHSASGEGATFWFTLPFGPAGTSATPEPLAPAPTDTRPLRILVAEDNEVNQLILAEQLSTMGHASLTVTNGREVMEEIERSVWDAILLDCQMPVMDGYETIAAIRSREAAGAPRTWTVAITAADGGEREACLKAGMDDFLSKPFHFRDLAQILARIPPRADMPHDPVIASKLADLRKSRSSSGGNLLDRMVQLFTESGPQILADMDRALAAGDFSAAVQAAHKLGGGCIYFGADDLRALCSEAERLGRADDHAGVRAIALRIREEYERVETALRRNQSRGLTDRPS